MSRMKRVLIVVIAASLALALTAVAISASAQQATQRSRSRNAATSRPAESSTTVGENGNRYGLSKPLPRTPGAIRIATYNMLNFFDNVDDPSLQGEFDDIKNATSPERCAKLAEAIKAVDADIIALQEVESLDALKWFRDTYLPDAGYKYIESKDVGYFRGVECSVMSRFQIVSSKVWLNESLDNVKRDGIGWAPKPKDVTHLSYQRSPLMVDIITDSGYKITIFSEHHKAGSAEFKYHREAEALRNMETITALEKDDPTRNIAIMGD